MIKVALGCDDAGLEYKDKIKEYLCSRGMEVYDLGLATHERTADYPDYAIPATRMVADGRCDYGVLICGTGIGMSICANKVKGIRCGLCTNEFSAEATRQHNDANMLALGARVITLSQALAIVKVFFDTPFSGAERHTRRINKIKDLEEHNFK